jgi:NAD(P)H-dependent FMN reductase
LPHFNPDIEASGVPESVTQWRLALTASDAVLIACPEYGFSLPGVLKNSIEWVIGSGELEQKVVAITAAVAGPERGRRGLQALRDSLSAVRVTIVGGEPITKGPGFETQVAALVQALVEATASSRDHSGILSAQTRPRSATLRYDSAHCHCCCGCGGAQPTVLAAVERSGIDEPASMTRFFEHHTAASARPPSSQFGRELDEPAQRRRIVR